MGGGGGGVGEGPLSFDPYYIKCFTFETQFYLSSSSTAPSYLKSRPPKLKTTRVDLLSVQTAPYAL